MTVPIAPALAVSTDRLPPFNAELAHSATNPCRHDWVEVGSCEFACTRCGATYSYDTDPVQARQGGTGDSEIAPGDGPKMEQSPLVEQVFFGWVFEVPSVTYAQAIRRG
jgi:hypothetical protein